MLRKLRRLASLSPDEWLLLPQLFLAALTIGAGTRLLPLSYLARVLSRCARHPWLCRVPALHRQARLERLTALVDIAARATCGGGYCLRRSLLLFWLLSARDTSVRLLIGVAKEADVLHGHAWVERGGEIVGDSPEVAEQFATVLTFDPR
ncbi:MAG: lasso peptide biosynthesis B2 protein [Nitrospirota bacterium]